MGFLEYIKQQRNDFVKIAGTYTVTDHLKLRTEIDNLLIAYDQMSERLRVFENDSNENSGLHKHIVSQHRELLYGFITWHNAKPQKERKDMIYVSEVEDYLKP